jgi:hypothetical protein
LIFSLKALIVIFFCVTSLSCSRYNSDFHISLDKDQQLSLDTVYLIRLENKLDSDIGKCIRKNHTSNSHYLITYRLNSPKTCFIDKKNYKKCPRMNIIPSKSTAQVVLYKAKKTKYITEQLKNCAMMMISQNNLN